MTPTPDASSSSRSGPANPAASDEALKRTLRYVLQAGETVIWAERPTARLLPETTTGYLNWLPVALLPLLGGLIMAFSIDSSQSTDRVLPVIAFALVWMAITVSAAYFTITRPRHTICVLTDRRFFSLDTRIPFLADSYWKRVDSSAPIRAVSLQGRLASPVLVLQTLRFTREMKVAEFAGLSDAREVAELICKTLNCSNFKDLTP